jgi:hypothetical protein
LARANRMENRENRVTQITDKSAPALLAFGRAAASDSLE